MNKWESDTLKAYEWRASAINQINELANKENINIKCEFVNPEFQLHDFAKKVKINDNVHRQRPVFNEGMGFAVKVGKATQPENYKYLELRKDDSLYLKATTETAGDINATIQMNNDRYFLLLHIVNGEITHYFTPLKIGKIKKRLFHFSTSPDNKNRLNCLISKSKMEPHKISGGRGFRRQAPPLPVALLTILA